MSHDPATLPDGLPAPEDDGAVTGLLGRVVPDLAVPSTDGVEVNLRRCSDRRPVVVFAYPRTGRPGVEPLSADWDRIPGARGCTPQACGFRDLAPDFDAAGADLFGLSTQDTKYQAEAAVRLRLNYPLLSDERLVFARAFGLPTFEVAGTVLLRRCTLILTDGVVRDVLYPVFPPDEAAGVALAALRSAAG